MTWDELISGYASSEGAIALTVALAFGLWAARRFGLVQELTTSYEVAAVLPVAVSHVLASLHAGKSWKEALVLGALVFLAPMKWNSDPLPAKPSSAGGIGPASLLLVAMLSLSGCSSILPALVHIGNVAQLVHGEVTLVGDAARLWAASHPDDSADARRMTEALERAQQALTVLQRLGAGAAAWQAGDVERAKDELLDAYRELYSIAQELGIVPGVAPQLTSYSARAAEAAPVRQVEALSPAELAELLRGEQ